MKEAQHQVVINVRYELWERELTGTLKKRVKDGSKLITLIAPTYQECDKMLEDFLSKLTSQVTFPIGEQNEKPT